LAQAGAIKVASLLPFIELSILFLLNYNYQKEGVQRAQSPDWTHISFTMHNLKEKCLRSFKQKNATLMATVSVLEFLT